MQLAKIINKSIKCSVLEQVQKVAVTLAYFAQNYYLASKRILTHKKGHNLVETLTDVTAHAELQAITAAASTIGGKYLNDCTLYVTVEPCPMCAGALAWSQIGRIVYGASDPKRGFSTIANNILHPRTVVSSGVLHEECERLMTDFFAKLR